MPAAGSLPIQIMGQWFDKLTIPACRQARLSEVEGMRALGLEPRTYGLKGRDDPNRCLPCLSLCAFFGRQY